MSGQHTGKFWKPEEIDLLAKVFPTTPTKELMQVFRCSVKVIQRMAALQGLKKDEEWLKKFRRENSIAILKAGPNIHRPKKGSILTMFGFQEVKIVPAARLITHRISDVPMRAR